LAPVWKISSITVIDVSQSRPSSWLQNRWYELSLTNIPATDSAPAFKSADHSRKESHLPRHQTRQLSHWPTQHKSRQCHSRCGFRHGQTISRSQDKAAHSLPRAKVIIWHSSLHEYQHALGTRTVTKRRPGSSGPCFHVLFERWTAMAGSQGSHQQTKVRKDWGKEADNSHQRPV
jgi:hypothetical protein